MTETRKYITLNAHPEYENTTDEPWIVRRKCDGKIVNSWIDKKKGYYKVCLNGKHYLLHRVIAEQFIDNPDNLTQIDHINRCRTDNRIENLRWVSNSINQRNTTSRKNIKYEYIDELPNGFIPFTEYKMISGEIRHFENLYVNFDDEIPKFITNDSGHQYRFLYHNETKNCVSRCDINNKYCHICFSRISKTQNGINITQQGINQTQQTLATTLNTMSQTLNTMANTLQNLQANMRPKNESDDDDEIDQKIIDEAVAKLRPHFKQEADDEDDEEYEQNDDHKFHKEQNM
jgi:hypothetical protein